MPIYEIPAVEFGDLAFIRKVFRLEFKKKKFKATVVETQRKIFQKANTYCQGIRRIRIGIPGNSANIRRGTLWYSPEYFRNSDF